MMITSFNITVDIALIQFLILILIFILGILGVLLNKNNFLLGLISIELIVLSTSLMFILVSFILDDFIGTFFSFLLLIVAAADAAVGIAIVLHYYACTNHVSYGLVLRG